MADKNLTGLTPREAIADALHRCVLGLDSNNRDLFESACRKNENITVIAGAIKIEGWTAINNFFARVFAVVTTHTISNIRIELIDGADTAFMTAHAISYHVRPDDAFKSENASYTASSLYAIDLVKDGDDRLWKIKRWDIKVLWTTGDIAVLHGQDKGPWIVVRQIREARLRGCCGVQKKRGVAISRDKF